MSKKTKKTKRRKRQSRLRQLIPYLAIILIAGALIVAVIGITGRQNQQENPDIVESISNTDSQNLTNKEHLKTEGNEEIQALAQHYFDAVTQADADTRNEIVKADTPYQQTALEQRKEIFESYHDIVCYSTQGAEENTYLVYVSYSIKFYGIETPAPALICWYLRRGEDSSLYIDLTEKSEEETAWIEEVSSWEEVRDLANDVNTRLQEAYAKDASLKELREMLEGRTSLQSTVDEDESGSQTEQETDESGSQAQQETDGQSSAEETVQEEASGEI